MKKRKQFVLYKDFQKNIAFSLILFLIISNLIIGGTLAGVMFYNNERILKLNKSQKKIALELQAKTITADKKVTIDSKLQNLMIVNSKNTFLLGKITRSNKILVMVIGVFLILFSIIAYIRIIRRTHRIAGPIYIISKYIQDIIEGNLPETRQLRKQDELQEFHAKFVDMVNTLKAKENK